jgi:hypothetical protein
MSQPTEQQMISTLIQLNNNMVKVLRLLEEIKRDGLKVRTQQSHA